MRTNNISCVFILSLFACNDGDLTVTTVVTTHSTMTSPSTNVTGDEPTSEAGFSETGSIDTEGPSSTTTNTTETGDTIGTTDTTGEEEGDPIPVVPDGCAFFAEVAGRESPEVRWVIIDASLCSRTSLLTVRFTGNNDPETSAQLPSNPCALIGGPDGPAGQPGAIPRVVSMIGDAVNPKTWRATLLVDDVISDVVRVPAILQGQEWLDAPDAPTTPVRRRDDWSWVPIEKSIMSCGLLVAD